MLGGKGFVACRTCACMPRAHLHCCADWVFSFPSHPFPRGQSRRFALCLVESPIFVGNENHDEVDAVDGGWTVMCTADCMRFVWGAWTLEGSFVLIRKCYQLCHGHCYVWVFCRGTTCCSRGPLAPWPNLHEFDGSNTPTGAQAGGMPQICKRLPDSFLTRRPRGGCNQSGLQGHRRGHMHAWHGW